MKKATENVVSNQENEAYTIDNIVSYSTAMEDVHDKIKEKISKTIPADVGSPSEKPTESAAQIYEDAGMPDIVSTSLAADNVDGKLHISDEAKQYIHQLS